MITKKLFVSAGMAALLVSIAAAPAHAKAVTVMEDAAGDAGNQDSGIPGFDQMGVDLISGSLEKSGTDLVFTVTHAAMPAPGSMPEVARLMWHFGVDGEQFRVTAKSFDIGKPDPIAMTGQERVGQVYTAGVFRLETCTEDPQAITLINCNTLEYLEGAFDPAAMTASWNLPMSLVKAKKGSLITGGTAWSASSGCQICWVSHLAERSLTATTIIDSAAQSVTFKVPKK